MQFFAYAHLPEKLAAVSKPFCELALELDRMTGNDLVMRGAGEIYALTVDLPSNLEASVAAEKLRDAADSCDGLETEYMFRLILEAKDCAVRSVLYKEPE